MIVEDYKENYKSGWVKIYRSITKHWLWPKRELTQLEAWMLILIEVNHSGEKVKIGYEIIECKRGEKLYSLETWAKLFKWNKSKVRRFFKLLQNESMIELKSEQNTTHLTVCNYDSYQQNGNGSETKVKRKRNKSETKVTPIKEYKNDKEYIYTSFYDYQLTTNNDKTYLLQYEKYIQFLTGDNPVKRPLNKLLNMTDQISYDNFVKLIEKCKANGKKLTGVTMELENYSKKNYKSLFLTLNKWCAL